MKSCRLPAGCSFFIPALGHLVHLPSRSLSFPSSAWERLAAKLRFASETSGRSHPPPHTVPTRSGASPPCVPKRSLGTRTCRDRKLYPCRPLVVARPQI